MHVDVDFVVGHLQEKQRCGKNGRRQNVAIGLVNSVQDQPVAHQSPVHKNVDTVAIHALNVRPRCESTDCEGSLFFPRLQFRLGDRRAKGGRNGGDFHQLFERLPSEELIDAVGQLFRWRTVDNFLRRRDEDKLLRRIRQRVMCNQRSDVAQLCSIRLEKFSARRNTVENVGDADRRSCRQSRRLYVDQLPPREFDARAFGFRLVARLQQQSRHRSDRRQSFPAKPQRGNRKQIVGGFELARGVALKRQQRVVMRHSVAVVNHADHALAAHFHFNPNGFRSRIDGVFEQLFHHRRRPLDNFARRDFIRHRLRQYAYPAHDVLMAVQNIIARLSSQALLQFQAHRVAQRLQRSETRPSNLGRRWFSRRR